MDRHFVKRRPVPKPVDNAAWGGELQPGYRDCNRQLCIIAKPIHTKIICK
jgi:hypothetical protein